MPQVGLGFFLKRGFGNPELLSGAGRARARKTTNIEPQNKER
jgi:hypothetical protein